MVGEKSRTHALPYFLSVNYYSACARAPAHAWMQECACVCVHAWCMFPEDWSTLDLEMDQAELRLLPRVESRGFLNSHQSYHQVPISMVPLMLPFF